MCGCVTVMGVRRVATLRRVVRSVPAVYRQNPCVPSSVDLRSGRPPVSGVPRRMESFMNRSVFRSALVAFLALALGVIGTNAYAQGGVTQPLAGTVVDASGAVIPGADVSAKHNGTGVVTTAVTNSEGVFSMPAMAIGTYT